MHISRRFQVSTKPLGVIPQKLWEERVKTERIDSLMAAADRARAHYQELRQETARDYAAEAGALASVARYFEEAAQLAETMGGGGL